MAKPVENLIMRVEQTRNAEFRLENVGTQAPP